ncbi:MAG: chemotaxis protein CheW [Planctomycetota bacterium]
MPDLNEILDELAWASSTEDAPSEETLAEILKSLSALQDLPRDILPRELTETLDDLVDLARVAEADTTRRGALAMVMHTVFGSLDRSEAAKAAQSAANHADDDDDDLLAAFVAACTDGLQDLEQSLLALEGTSDPDELADAKRTMHTLKGECGVLSLHDAQNLWHEAESMIEVAIERGLIVPIDPLMALLDWHRAYIEILAADPKATAPPTGDIASRIASALDNAETAVDLDGDPIVTGAADASESTASTPGALVTFSDATLADETIPEFITEAQAHLEDSEGALLELAEDPSSEDGIDRVFRAFHTIKGVAGFLELEPVTRVAHIAETLLDKFRGTGLAFQPVHADAVLESKDMLARLMDALTGEPGPEVASFEALISALEEMAADPANASPVGARAVKDVLKSAGLETEAEFAEAAKDPLKTTARLGSILVAQGILSQEQLDKAVAEQKVLVDRGEPIRLGDMLTRLELITDDQLKSALDFQSEGTPLAQLLGGQSDTLQPSPPSATPTAPASEPAAAASTAAASAPKQASGARRATQVDQTIRVNMQRLDALVDMVGELVIAQQMVVQGTEEFVSQVDESLGRNLSHMGKITRDLQEASMSLRMVTFKSTFQKMHRLVRDVAAKAGKRVRLTVEGADTEVDRNVVDKISDPLVHLVRNAIDHGLEPPDERQSLGKEAQGTVVLSARHQGGAIVISLQDDGRGLSRSKIIAKAAERGLLPRGTSPDELTDAAVHRLIFEPGFSTAAQVTDISGRGVGMDVVKRNIEAMRGKIEILSKEGEGTTFQIHLPLTLAIIDAMVVRSGEQRFVIPTLSIVQSFQPEPNQMHSIRGDEPVVEVRGQLVPIQPLSASIGSGWEPPPGPDSTLILVEAMGRRLCLGVDEIIGQQQVVIKKLGDGMPTLNAVSGGAILGDGRVALIVDVEGVLSTSESTARV